MPEAIGLSPLCGQAARIPGHNAAAGREPGGFDPGDQFAEEVRRPHHEYHCEMGANGNTATSITPTSTLSASPSAPLET